MKFSFLIVNYNGLDDVKLGIQAIEKSIGSTEHEIIIFDNGSTDGSREYFESRSLQNIKYIYSKENLGYGAGNNRAFSHSSGEILVLMNPDVGAIEGNLFDFLDRKKADVGAWGPRLSYPDGGAQANGGGKSTPWTFVFQTLRLGYLFRKSGLIEVVKKLARFGFFKKTIIGAYLENFDKEPPLEREWYWMSGAFLVIPRAVYKSIGGFDENFFLYNEDEDLCIAIRNLGLRIVQYGDLNVVHVEGSSHKGKSGNRLGRAYAERMKSRVYFSSKHFSASSYLCVKIYLGAFCLVRAVLDVLTFKVARSAEFVSLACEIILLRKQKVEKRMS